MNAWLPVLTLATSLVTALLIFGTPESARRMRTAINLVGAMAKIGLVLVMLVGVAAGELYETRLALAPGLDLVLRVDALCLLFLTLSALLWLLTTIYAISYFGEGPNQARFFGFFSLCVAATTGVALSGTLVTFFIFYEFLTLSTWPLVAHKGDDASIAAGRQYLAYTLCGSAVLLVGMVWLEALAGPVDFSQPGELIAIDTRTLQAVFLLLVAGLGVKAALIPLHGWLPAAMVAPAPVSALLHAVAVVKAGAFGIIRVIYDVYGFTLVQAIGVGIPLAALAAATIFWGSLRALYQTDIKRRLAYSTVSQISYIVLGTALAGSAATVGGLAHLVHQGLMKITLFFCAGALAERMNVTRVNQLDGTGRAMPLTMFAFSIAAVGMVGIPPVAGFVSKWQLGLGALQAGQLWVIIVLGLSSLLNAAYFLPLVYRAWFKPAVVVRLPGGEGPSMLILPAVATAALALLVGLFAGLPFSPLRWAQLIVERNYGL
jgi:multicomponent Na+:H+ antiporter subunit D